MTFSKTYESPLSTRYASSEMTYLFSPHFKYTTWRALWIALAQGEQHLGLPITDAQIKELEAQRDHLDAEQCHRLEKELRHDVVAHIHAYGLQCPSAKKIIHLGATSCYVTDNGDLIAIQRALKLLLSKLSSSLEALSAFAQTHAHLACLGFTHFQPAQPTTVGKRACLWLQDLLTDLKELSYRLETLPFLGVKGATGTQASFLSLFNGNAEKVHQLDAYVTETMGFKKPLTIAAQTYPRKVDQLLINALAGLASSIHKLATDLRLLAHLGEIEEPFSSTQVGSSAMPYKRNPIRAERLCSLSRYLIALSSNPAYTTSTQWLERSLDDSANRRLTLPEAFLTADSLLNELYHLTKGLKVNPKNIANRLKKELPFLAIENILMEAVKRGNDRQSTHETLKNLALQAKENPDTDLLFSIAGNDQIGLTLSELNEILSIDALIGLAPAQVIQFITEELKPTLASLAIEKQAIEPPSV